METTDSMIKKLFTRMDDWRHLPSYQLERRVDLFFSLYIPEVISKIFECEVKDELIPEFPVKLSIIYNNKNNDKSFDFDAKNYNLNSNHSVKIDYVAITKNHEKAFLIELKTDKHSIKPEQVKNLFYSGDDFSALIGGIQEIYCNSASDSIYRNKYNCLLNKLDSMGLFGEIGVFKEAYHNKGTYEDLSNRVSNFKPISNIEMKKVYIAPTKTNTDLLEKNNIEFITFQEFVKIAQKNNSEDKISSQFINYLREWDETAAGDKKILNQ